jgi:hypothetical protein
MAFHVGTCWRCQPRRKPDRWKRLSRRLGKGKTDRAARPALDQIITTSEPVMEIASNMAGNLSNAEARCGRKAAISCSGA